MEELLWPSPWTIYNPPLEILSNRILHELIHLVSVHEITLKIEKNSDLVIQSMQSRQGLHTQTDLVYSVDVPQITFENWDSVLETIGEILRNERNEQNIISSCKNSTTVAIIEVLKVVYGAKWFHKVRDQAMKNPEVLYNTTKLEINKQMSIGFEINETLVEFQARIAAMQNPLYPTQDELEWFLENGAYRKLDSITNLVKYYNSLTETSKKLLIADIQKTLSEGNLEILFNSFKKSGLKISLEELQQANLKNLI